MKTVLLPELANAAKNSMYRLSPQKTQHVRKVLRMEWGESLHVSNGHGVLYSAVLEKSGDAAGVMLKEIVKISPEGPAAELLIGLSKNSTMDWLVEKAVECGVTKILPVITSRSVVRPNSKELTKYSERWQIIMDGAVEQSERLWRPTVEAPIFWTDFTKQASERQVQCVRVGFFSELRAESTFSEKESLANTWKVLQKSKANGIQFFIGPEGGFSEAERNELNSLGFESLSLGDSVLRVETAVVAALSLIKISRAL